MDIIAISASMEAHIDHHDNFKDDLGQVETSPNL